MPADASTARFSSASSARETPESDDPCSVRDALLSSLKRESPEMPDAPETEQAEAGGPERKRRRRRGIKDPSLKLNDDMMQQVLPYLAKTSPRHLFLLAMVNWDHHALVVGAHDVWERLFRAWERGQCGVNVTRSLGSDFAARCFQSMPKWMVKHSPSVFNHRRMHPSMPVPYVAPVLGNSWRAMGVPEQLQLDFGRYARKVLCLWHIGCCGMCGTRQGKQRAIWTLNMRVCRGCWFENIVSHRTLLQEYGVSLLKPLEPDGQPLFQLIRNRVFYIRNFMPSAGREKYTQALADFPDGQACVPLWLLWRPHLERIVDLAGRRAEYQAKREACARLTSVFRRRYALSLRDKFQEKQRSVLVQRVWRLRHNEIRRQLQPKGFVDVLEDWRYAHHRQQLVDYADLLPEPERYPLVPTGA